MEKVIINEKQRGFLFKDGKYVKTLGPGKYWTFGERKIEISELGHMIESRTCTLDTLLADAEFAAQVTVAEVKDEELVLHYVDGKFAGIIIAHGKYAYWNAVGVHEYRPVDISTPEVTEDFPAFVFEKIPDTLYKKVEVAEYQKGRLFYNNRFERLLEPGTYYFWKTAVKTEVDFVDTRLTQMNITGQEIMTQDKVALRISFVCGYRVTDYVKILTEVNDYAEQLHVAAQLALREFVGRYRLDEILQNKDGITAYVLEKLREKETELYVQILDGGVKDIILPGEIRDIMNTVLVAEKKAQANVIARREEVASTRSLLNTAKLMEENQTLYRLKELEYVERICGNVGSIQLNGNTDMMSQLLALLGTTAERQKERPAEKSV